METWLKQRLGEKQPAFCSDISQSKGAHSSWRLGKLQKSAVWEARTSDQPKKRIYCLEQLSLLGTPSVGCAGAPEVPMALNPPPEGGHSALRLRYLVLSQSSLFARRKRGGASPYVQSLPEFGRWMFAQFFAAPSVAPGANLHT